MPYCTAGDVRLVLDTVLTDAEVVSVIALSDAEIDRRIGSRDPSDALAKKLSVLLTAHTIKARQPRSLAIGEYREDAGDVMEVWEREIDRIYRLYGGVSVSASEYRHLDEDSRYPEGA